MIRLWNIVVLVVLLAPGRADSGASPQSKPEITAFGGYTQMYMDYPLSERRASTFALRRSRLFVTGKANARVDFKVMVDLARNSAILMDAFATIRLKEGAVIKAGQFKPPFSRDELTSARSLLFVDRSLINGDLAFGRDLGMELAVESNKLPGLGLQVAVFNGAGRYVHDNDDFKDLVARLRHRPNPHLELAAAVMRVRREGDVSFTRFVGSGAFLKGGWQLEGEYMQGEVATKTVRGFYAQLAGKMRLQNELLVAWQPVVRFGYHDREEIDRLKYTRVTLGVNLFLGSDDVQLALNYLTTAESSSGADSVEIENDQVVVQLQVLH